MAWMENPCKPDCRERSGDCHRSCPKYAEWEISEICRKSIEHREQQMQQLAETYVIEDCRDRIGQSGRKKNKLKLHGGDN